MLLLEEECASLHWLLPRATLLDLQAVVRRRVAASNRALNERTLVCRLRVAQSILRHVQLGNVDSEGLLVSISELDDALELEDVLE